jgi:HK97 family phage prohead protease
MLNRAYSLLSIKQIDEELRQITGMATTPTPDRLEDVVEPDGAQFKLPLALLWQHDSAQPIGHVTHAKVDRKGIEIVARLPHVNEAGKLKDRLDEAWQSIKAGLVRGLSIGFKPIAHEYIAETKGMRFTKWDWLELSVVTIPANAEANITTVRRLAQPVPQVETVSQPSDEEKARLAAKARWIADALGGKGSLATASAVQWSEDELDSPATVGMVLDAYKALTQRLRELEARPVPKYVGVWDNGKVYQRGDFVTRSGCLWHCWEAHCGVEPGSSDTWQLAVKCGRDGKDARK